MDKLSDFHTNLLNDLKTSLPDAVLDVINYQGDVTFIISRNLIHEVCLFLKDKHHFKYLVDIVATDRFTSEDRFEVIYNLFCLRNPNRILVKVRLDEDNPILPTTTDIWPAANWNEREAYDMMGIQFEGHPDLRRIFLPEDFEYFPLRKEFPLLGIPGSIPLPSTTPDSQE